MLLQYVEEKEEWPLFFSPMAEIIQLMVSKPTQTYILLQVTACLTYTICYWLTVYEEKQIIFPQSSTCVLPHICFFWSNQVDTVESVQKSELAERHRVMQWYQMLKTMNKKSRQNMQYNAKDFNKFQKRTHT